MLNKGRRIKRRTKIQKNKIKKMLFVSKESSMRLRFREKKENIQSQFLLKVPNKHNLKKEKDVKKGKNRRKT